MISNELPPYSASAASNHKGFHYNNGLPHLDQPNLTQMITFRLADSLPLSKVKEVLDATPPPKRFQRIDQYLDACLGSCCLKHEAIGKIVEDALLFFADKRYRLLAWVVMPNHVHVLLEVLPGHPIDRTIFSWKSFTARQINKLQGSSGQLWQREYFDRFIRDEEHLESAAKYIHFNPVRAGLCERMEDWSFSSYRLLSSAGAVKPSQD